MSLAYRHVYLAPHYDDAALSCGGMIHHQAQAGQPVLVVTVCAAPPDSTERLSPLAEIQHRQWDQPTAHGPDKMLVDDFISFGSFGHC